MFVGISICLRKYFIYFWMNSLGEVTSHGRLRRIFAKDKPRKHQEDRYKICS